jgi:hypothetical protein
MKRFNNFIRQATVAAALLMFLAWLAFGHWAKGMEP